MVIRDTTTLTYKEKGNRNDCLTRKTIVPMFTIMVDAYMKIHDILWYLSVYAQVSTVII